MDKEEDKKDIESIDGLTETEQHATNRGWSPKSEWEGEPDQWIDAPTFVRQGELMDRISSQTKQLKSQSSEIGGLKNAMQSLAETNKKIAIKEYEKAIKDIKRQKVEALESDDHTSVIELDEQMSDLKIAKKELDVEEPQQVNETIHPDVIEWMDKNTWYESDVILRGAADSLTAEYISKNPLMKDNPRMTLDYVEQELKKEFPHKFSERRRPTATVDSDSSGRAKSERFSGKTKYTKRHLTPEQKKIAETIVNTGVMSMQEYVDQLAELGEVEG